ncbi:uncharacterized protein DUF2059 [Pseudomonas duriflava]|uniref:Uncharacterized protein DUF2059 n=1 Tax=Pseudomonas duriflava TaxID=459528 RepID=A0A562Q6F3_9PSED|nr:DUF2059 domain-containing protein [Pseudomonas duriflava]TWI52288.1 uncharacterized protein DUF2059 [Pseudomonas duriflava]
MRVFIAFVLLVFGLPALADNYQALYQAAGWPEQRGHFRDALQAAQQRYQNSLPPALYQTLVDNSNRRFTAEAIDQRAIGQLRLSLPEVDPALQFFQSPVGRKVVAAEVSATRSDQIARSSSGLPKVQASPERLTQIRRLASAIPAREAGAEVSMALAGLAADSLSQMLPGLLGQAQGMIGQQRERIMQQMNNGDLENTLLYVYRGLTDAELGQFADFASSPQGTLYYQAALAALKAGLGSGSETL